MKPQPLTQPLKPRSDDRRDLPTNPHQKLQKPQSRWIPPRRRKDDSDRTTEITIYQSTINSHIRIEFLAGNALRLTGVLRAERCWFVRVGRILGDVFPRSDSSRLLWPGRARCFRSRSLPRWLNARRKRGLRSRWRSSSRWSPWSTKHVVRNFWTCCSIGGDPTRTTWEPSFWSPELAALKTLTLEWNLDWRNKDKFE